MAKDSADDILELMDIVEEGKLPDFTDKPKPKHAGKEPSFDDELDALFGDTEPGHGTAESPVDLNEKLDMPDMSDLDSLLDDLGDESVDIAPEPELDKQVEGVDEILADLLPEAPEAVKTVPEAVPFKSTTGIPDDDFDALLDELGSEDGFASAKVAANGSGKTAPVREPEVKNTETDPELDALFEELDLKSESAMRVPSEPDVLQEDDDPFSGQEPELMAEMASTPDLKPREQIKASASSGESDNESEIPLDDLDALIDDIMTPAPPVTKVASASAVSANAVTKADAAAKSVPAPRAPAKQISKPQSVSKSPVPSVEDLPAPELDFLAEAATPQSGIVPTTVPEAHVESAPVEVELSKVEISAEQAASTSASAPLAQLGEAELNMLAEQLVGGPLLAAVHTLVMEEVQSRFKEYDKANEELGAKFAALEKRLEDRLNETVDKAAAAAAAKVIREEIAALLQEM